jgi:nitronate monooxygenase
MRLKTRATDLLSVEHPIIQAPMAGGPTTPELVAAVSNAGGLGSLGAAYLAPEEIREQVGEVRRLTDRPFAVNLFVPEPFEADPEQIECSGELLGPYREELGIEDPGEPSSYAQDFGEQFEAILEEGVPVFSFTFGALSASLVRRLKEDGVVVIGTATTVREGVRLQEDGADLVVAQGAEAGGHRGTFLGAFGDSMIGTMALVPQLADALGVPVVASGGVADGRGLAAALCLGAEAAQVGTAFLVAEESGAHPKYREAVLGATEEDTALTRAFSGKPARGIKNRFLDEMAGHEGELAPYPAQNALTGDLRKAAQEQDRPEFMSLWAGQGLRLVRPLPAAELVGSIIEGADAALRRVRE